MKSPTCRIILASTLLAIIAATGARAQEKRVPGRLTVEKYLDYEQVGEPQLSPDGRQVIYTRRFVDRMKDRWEGALWIMNADGSHNRFLAKGSSARWSPDGTRILFLAEGDPTGAQVFVRWMDTEGAATQITRAEESPSDVEWSRDGKSIGFTMFIPKPADWNIDMPAAPKDAKWTGAPRRVTSLHFRQDRKGFVETGYRHLFVVSADGGTPRQVTSGDFNVGSRFDGLDGSVGWDWSPDGRTIVVDGIADNPGDTNFNKSNIYAVDVATGVMRKLSNVDGAWSGPAISPDGRRIAYRGFTALNDAYHVSDLYVMNADGTGARMLAASLDRDVGDIAWSTDNAGLYFTAEDRGTSNVHFVTAAGEERAVTTGEHMLTGLQVSAGGAVAVRSSYQAPGDVVRVTLGGVSGAKAGAVTQLTRVNDDLLANVKLAEVERIRYPSTSGATVDGWIVKPPGFDPARKYPLIMEIHGGPAGMYNVGFNFMFQNFAANDYVVIYTNPRGSTGYGSAFGNAIKHAYPSVDYEDLMAGVDTLAKRGYIDTQRMYVGGCSGGGVLSSWTIGHTDRFAAAAVRCPVTDWMSMAGQTDIPLFTYNFFDAPFWEKPEQWLKQSPLMYVGKVTTPTLVMTGELDRRTPMPQSEEYYSALKVRGIPSELLRFEGEFHGTSSKPSNFMRTQLYMMSWYNKWRRNAGGQVSTVTAASTS